MPLRALSTTGRISSIHLSQSTSWFHAQTRGRAMKQSLTRYRGLGTLHGTPVQDNRPTTNRIRLMADGLPLLRLRPHQRS